VLGHVYAYWETQALGLIETQRTAIGAGQGGNANLCNAEQRLPPGHVGGGWGWCLLAATVNSLIWMMN